MKHLYLVGSSGKRKRKPSSPTGDKTEADAAKSDVPPTPEVAETKPEEEEGEGDGEENEEEKAPKTVSKKRS